MQKGEKPQSVQDLMQKMAKRMDALLDAHERTQKARETGQIPDELRFWLAADPLLADLHKQFLDARAHHLRLKRLRGAGDPMTDVADDMVDSTQCAFETRLLELRKDEETKRTVMALMRRAHDLRQRHLNEVELARTADFWRWQAMPKGRARAIKEADHSVLFVLMGLMALSQGLNNMQAKLSAVLAFTIASKDRRAEIRQQLLAG